MSKKINNLKKNLPANQSQHDAAQTSLIIRSPWRWITFLSFLAIFSSLSCKSSTVHESPETDIQLTRQPPEETPVTIDVDHAQPCPPDEENQLLIESYLAVNQLRDERTSQFILRRHSCQTMKDETASFIMYSIRIRCGSISHMPVSKEPDIFLEQYLAWVRANEDTDSSHTIHKLLRFIKTMPLPDGKPENHFCQPTQTYCQKHADCKSYGICGLGAVNNDFWGTRSRCAGVTAESCAASTECKYSGKCSPSPDQSRCIIATPDDCKNSRDCKTSGRCSPAPDHARCIVATPDDCKHTEGCQTQGLCVPDDKGMECIDPHENCEDRAVCKLHGQCGAADSTEAGCEIRGHADCEASEACKEKGLCTAILRKDFYGSNYCSLEFDRDCEQTTACKEQGLCKLKPDEGCVKESGLIDGAGWPLDHVCPKDTRREVQRRCVVNQSFDGDEQKKCGKDFVICSPTTASCQQQPACKTDGHCGTVEELFSDAESLYQYECSQTDNNDKCSPGIKICGLSTEGCAQLEACKISGNCSVHLGIPDYGYQEPYEVCAPKSDADCAQSAICKQSGACTYISTQMMPLGNSHTIPYCTPGSAKDCQQSEGCIKENRCQFEPGGNLISEPGRCVL